MPPSDNSIAVDDDDNNNNNMEGLEPFQNHSGNK
jgi:hypothetical protein